MCLLQASAARRRRRDLPFNSGRPRNFTVFRIHQTVFRIHQPERLKVTVTDTSPARTAARDATRADPGAPGTQRSQHETGPGRPQDHADPKCTIRLLCPFFAALSILILTGAAPVAAQTLTGAVLFAANEGGNYDGYDYRVTGNGPASHMFFRQDDRWINDADFAIRIPLTQGLHTLRFYAEPVNSDQTVRAEPVF